MKKNAMAIILALCMVIAMLPAPVFAAYDGPQLACKTLPAAVGKLEPAAIEPNAKSYKVSLSGGSHGTTELLVSSPAEKGSEVYFQANPDDGYLAEIYFDGLSSDDLVYIGADVWGFIMPGNKVTLEVEYVPAEGESHRITTHESGSGQCAVERSSAKPFESVLVGVLPDDADDFDPMEYVWCDGATMFYLFEDNGIHYYEILMGQERVTLFVVYGKVGPFRISAFRTSGEESCAVTIEPKQASFLDTVTVTIVPAPGYELTRVKAVSYAGDLVTDLVPLGGDRYSFTMHPANVDLYIDTERTAYPVTVRYGEGGEAYADCTLAEVGDTVTVTCVPDEKYQVAGITGADGIVARGDNTYTFPMPAREVVIDVTFSRLYNPVTVTVDTGLGGTASADVSEAKAGDTVTLTCVSEEGYRVAQITGAEVTDNGDGTYTFVMPAGPADIHVLFLRLDNPFVDINETQFFYDSVLWAVDKGITDGIDDTHFGPYQTSNRATVVTMLWRYAGSPEPTTTENPFEDVPADSWYTKPVLWAVENEITTGISPNQFGPGMVCNRAQVVTFLYRYMKAAAPEGVENPFEDVPAGEWYEMPVLWALTNGITTGTGAAEFSPAGECLRSQFVTFLYRASRIPVSYELHWVINGFRDTPSEYGTVTLSHSTAQSGEIITATVIPAEGYVIDWVRCESGSEITRVSETEYTFFMPESEEVFHVNFVEEATEPEPTDPEEPTQPVKTYDFILKDNGFGKVSYRDGVSSAAPGESIFFYAIPDEGYYLSGVEIFNPYNEIDVSKVLVYSHGDNLFELVMIDHQIVMTCIFSPLP